MKTDINLADVNQVARVYKIIINQQQKQIVKKRLQSLLNQVKIINRLKKRTQKLDEITNICKLKNIFRDDQVSNSLKQDEVLSTASKTKNGFIKTIKILD